MPLLATADDELREDSFLPGGHSHGVVVQGTIREHMILALDIGGTKLAAAAVRDDGHVSSMRRRPTPATEDPEALWRTVIELLDSVPGPFEGVGVGCGGPMLPEGRAVSPLNIPAWRDFPLRSRLEAWSGLPVEVDNDAKALTVGEWWGGSLRGLSSVMAMVVSTGVGGGLVLDGRLVDGATGNAGHIGHVIVEPEGRRCGCGSRGCLEAEIGGPSLRAQAGHLPPFEAPLLERAGRLLGRGVASVAALCDLEAVAVGGGVAQGEGDRLLAPARSELARSFRIFSRRVELRPATAGPLVGAAGVFLYRRGAL
jgi:glucokinase